MAYFGFTDKLVRGRKAPERTVGEDGLPLPPYAVYNIGNSQPENLLDFVDILQREGLRKFSQWYKEFYHGRD